MAERDAFGNEISQEPLAGMGWTTGEGATPTPAQPASTPPPAMSAGAAQPGLGSANEAFGAPSGVPTPPPVPPGIPRVTRRRSFSGLGLIGVLLKIGIPLAIFVAIGATIANLGSSVSDRVEDARRAISTGLDGITVPTVPPSALAPGTEAPGTARTPPVGFGKGSLLRTGNFSDAMRVVEREGSRLRTLRVTADRLDATIVTNAGRMKQVQVTWDGRVSRSTGGGSGFSQAGTFPAGGILRGAPFRLSRSAAGRAKSSPSVVDYVVAISLGPGGEQQWTVILKDGKGQYLADNRGRITRRIN